MVFSHLGFWSGNLFLIAPFPDLCLLVPFDSISNEMLKTGCGALQKSLLKLFNCILCFGDYPTEWKCAYITPVHKGGSPDDPNNYRGISILSCIVKLFNTILTKRLDNFLEEKKIITPLQIGFFKEARTSNHMFVLRTIIEKYTHEKKGKLYTCFIDFHKAFDRVIHALMLYKLRNVGVTGNFYNVIKDMYVNNKLCVKMKSGFTQLFPSTIGVRQGDTLSPDLFKIFINDLPDIFDTSCDGIDIGMLHFNCLLYADDVILLSTTEAGLQNCISKLEKYCDDWCIEVNLVKSKVMIFNKAGKLYNCDFTYKGMSLDCVREYKYLGVLFSLSGSFSLASSELYKKGLKAFYKIKSIFGSTRPNSEVAFHVFDHTIKPILTYGSEIWGSCMKNSRTTPSLDKIYRDMHAEKLHLKYCKYVLGIHSKASNLATVGELGRFPIYNFICESISKFYLHIKGKEPDSLLQQTLQTSKQLHKNGIRSWYSGMDSVLNELKLDEENICSVKLHLNNLYKDTWSKSIEQEAVIKQGKLRTYALFKPFFQEEIYLEIVKDVQKRKCLTQLRVSAHRLEIESGRYKKKSASERLCKCCNLNAVEDEVHFLCNCSAYQNARQRFFELIIDKAPSFKTLHDSARFIWLLTCEEEVIINALSDFVFQCFELRNLTKTQ